MVKPENQIPSILATFVEEEEEELVSNCQPIGLHSSAVCGGESEKSRSVGPGAAVLMHDAMQNQRTAASPSAAADVVARTSPPPTRDSSCARPPAGRRRPHGQPAAWLGRRARAESESGDILRWGRCSSRGRLRA